MALPTTLDRTHVGLAGATLALLAAPFAAFADAPFAPGGTDALPGFWRAFHEAFLPLFTFASPRVVLDVWQLIVAAAFAAVIFAVRPLLNVTRKKAPRSGILLAGAFGLLCVHALGIVIESITFGWTTGESVGFALYFPTLFIQPLAATLAGVSAWRAGALGPGIAWPLTLAPVFLVAAMLMFQQFPGGTAPGLLAPWAIAAYESSRLEATQSPEPSVETAR